MKRNDHDVEPTVTVVIIRIYGKGFGVPTSGLLARIANLMARPIGGGVPIVSDDHVVFAILVEIAYANSLGTEHVVQGDFLELRFGRDSNQTSA